MNIPEQQIKTAVAQFKVLSDELYTIGSRLKEIGDINDESRALSARFDQVMSERDVLSAETMHMLMAYIGE